MFKKKDIRRRHLLLVVIILATLFVACKESSKFQPDVIERVPNFSSYRDIPGISSEEIEAIDALRKQYGYFKYGSVPSTEAFLKADGKIGGFAARLCEWLTTLFEIHFVPML